MEFLTGLAEKVDTMLQDQTTSIVVSLVLALYAGLAAPKLPDSVVKFFDTMLGKVIFIFLIGFVASKNVQIALMVAVAYVVTLHIANKRATEEYINFLRRERFMNYYELFDVKADNATAVKTVLCAKLPELLKAHDDAQEEDDDKVLVDGKLKDAKKELTVQEALTAIDGKLADDKKIMKDGELNIAELIADGKMLNGIALKKEDETDHATDNEENKKAYLAELKKIIDEHKVKKVVEVCPALKPSEENFENFEDEGPASGGQEDMDGDMDEMEFMDEGYEAEPNEMEGMESDFHENMEQFENFDVVPANNLNGNSNKMYAPVAF